MKDTPIIQSGQIIATSHDLTPNGGLVRETFLFQGKLGWWNIIIWPDPMMQGDWIPIGLSCGVVVCVQIIWGSFWCTEKTRRSWCRECGWKVFFFRRTWRRNPKKSEETIGYKWYIYIYGGFLKWWYPQIIHFNRVFHYRPSILGYPYFWKHQCIYLYVYVFIHTLEHWKSKDHWFSKGFIINNSRGCFFSWSKWLPG